LIIFCSTSVTSASSSIAFAAVRCSMSRFLIGEDQADGGEALLVAAFHRAKSAPA
jgi:hypothetical protein